jgi:PAS domain S-box-containing protein
LLNFFANVEEMMGFGIQVCAWLLEKRNGRIYAQQPFMNGENRFNILIAENQPADSQRIEHLLEESGGRHKVTVTSTFQETEEILRNENIDVVLISLALFGLSGMTLARLRKAAPFVPFIVMARIDNTSMGLNVLREGAQEYLVKDNLSSTLLSRTIRYSIQRNRTELALKESEDRLRDLAENSHDLICTHDLEGNILWVNPFPAALLGYELSELKKKKIQDILAPAYRNQFPEYIKAIQSSGFAKGVMHVITKTGEHRIWEYHNTLRTEGVDHPLVRGFGHDVTEITRAQENLRRSQERFQLSSLASQDVIFDWEVPTGTVWWSENLQQVFGHSSNTNLPIRWWMEQIHPDEVENIRTKWKAILQSESSKYTLEYRFRRSDGTYSNVQDRGFIVRKGEKAARVIGALSDISERIKYQEQALLSRRVEAIVRLAGGIAHDFNNLMMAIHVNCEVLQLKLSDRTKLKEIDAIMDAALKGSSLTHQLLSFSRKQIMQPSALDLGGFTLAMKPLLEEILGGGVQCEIELSNAPTPIHADASLVREVFTVLASNAKEAMSGSGVLKIHTECVDLTGNEASLPSEEMSPGHYVKLDFSDSGIGMTSEVRDRVFEPYFSTKDAGHGQGLSLASVYGIIKQSQGFIYAESEPSKGTTFHLYFPKNV